MDMLAAAKSAAAALAPLMQKDLAAKAAQDVAPAHIIHIILTTRNPYTPITFRIPGATEPAVI